MSNALAPGRAFIYDPVLFADIDNSVLSSHTYRAARNGQLQQIQKANLAERQFFTIFSCQFDMRNAAGYTVLRILLVSGSL